ncbi:MAG TPA: low molecular weight protein-tyrosine-phosphatase [Alphaproteobacteria bacterium]
MVRVLFVCMGNICRSPTARAVFESLAAERGLAGAVFADSAGTTAYHVGQAPDPRATAAAGARGYDLTGFRARQVRRRDFREFDLMLAMDRANRRTLRHMAPPGARAELRLFLDFAPALGLAEVPDPYYGGVDGFERVLDICEAGASGLLDHLGDGGSIGPRPPPVGDGRTP